MIILPQRSAVLVNSTDPAALTRLIPRSKIIPTDLGRGNNVVVHYGLDETCVLRNLGYKVPSPIRNAYRWPGPYIPYQHQYETAGFMTLYRRGFVLDEMGLGKSASALWAADYMMSQGKIRRCLIVCTLSTMHRVWANELFMLLTHRKAAIMYGSRDKRIKLAQENWEFGVINFEGLAIVKDYLKDLDMIIVDESATAYRNAKSKRYETFESVLKPQMRLWLMTGTPCPSKPTDVWAQCRLVNPAGVPHYFGTFRRATMQKITTFKWVAKPDGYEYAYKAMQPAIRHRKRDCLSLPPVVYEHRSAPMSVEQKRLFEQMRKMQRTEVENEKVLTAVNAADKLNKLRQIVLGAAKHTQTGEYIYFDFAPRAAVLLECIEQASNKVIVVVPFKGVLKPLKEYVEKHHTVEIINGDVKPKERNQIFEAFQTTPNPHTLLCHPRVMAHGLTLTEADTIIFYGPVFNAEYCQQVTERINRIGQTRKMTSVQIGIEGTPMEWRIYKIVQERTFKQETVLDLYKEVLYA